MRNRKTIQDYEESLYYDDCESHKGKILTKKEIEEGDFSRLEKFLEDYFLKSVIRHHKVNGAYSEDTPYVWFSNLVNWNFCREEIEFIIYYLNQKGIKIYSSETRENTEMVPDKNFFSYRDIAYRFKVLDKDYQNELLASYQQDKNLETRNLLLLSNMRLIYNCLKNFAKVRNLNISKVVLSDLEEVGIDALISAIESFKFEENITFQHYASKVIYHSFYNYFFRKKQYRDLITNFNEVRLIIEEKLGRSLEEDFSLLDDILEYMQEEYMFMPESYDEVKAMIIKTLKKYYGESTDTFETPHVDSDRKIDNASLEERILHFVKPYPSISRDLDVLKQVFGFQGDPISGRQFALNTGISKTRINARIRRLEKRIEESEDISKIFGDEALEPYYKK